MLSDILTKDVVALDVEGLETPEAVIEYCGKLLEKAGKIKHEYTQKMVEAFHTIGPYIVMAPGIAMPHARPSGDVLEPCVCFVRLKQPVKFNHPSNDPVKLVFALGGVAQDGHLDVLEAISGLLGNDDNLEKLEEITSYEELEKIM